MYAYTLHTGKILDDEHDTFEHEEPCEDFDDDDMERDWYEVGEGWDSGW